MEINKKMDGFSNEKLIILPRDIVNESSRNSLVKNLYITDIGFYPHAQYHYRERKEGSEQNILIYCVNGEGFVEINDERHKILKDTLFIIPKGKPHSYGSTIVGPWDIYWVHFNGELAESYLQSKDSITMIGLPGSTLTILTNLFDNIFDTLESGYTINNIIYANQCFGYFLASVFYMPYNKYTHEDKNIKHMKNSISFMEKNIDKSLSLEDLSTFVGLSKSHFNEVFKEKTGYSPIDFFIRLKMQKACSQLDLTDLSISEIALQVGYSDQYYFSRIFKKIMLKCPSDYRKIKKG
jgi:AraC family transcriptional regulator of arabinose operon